MRKTLVICLLLGLVLLPATVMAAGPRGQGIGGAQNNALQEQTGDSGTGTCQYQFCSRYGFDTSSTNGNGKMLRIRDCTADGDQTKTMLRNQTRLRDGSCGNCPVQSPTQTGA